MTYTSPSWTPGYNKKNVNLVSMLFVYQWMGEYFFLYISEIPLCYVTYKSNLRISSLATSIWNGLFYWYIKYTKNPIAILSLLQILEQIIGLTTNFLQ